MSAAEKLFQRMRATKAGWGQKDLDRLYTGFGFNCRAGKRHNFYSHPRFPEICATVARHDDLPTGYAQHALKCIENLKRLLKEEGGTEHDEN